MPHQVELRSRLSQTGTLLFFLIGGDITTPGEEGTTSFRCYFPEKSKHDQLKKFTYLQKAGMMNDVLQNMFKEKRLDKSENWDKTQKGTATFQLTDGVWISIPEITEKVELKKKIQYALG